MARELRHDGGRSVDVFELMKKGNERGIDDEPRTGIVVVRHEAPIVPIEDERRGAPVSWPTRHGQRTLRVLFLAVFLARKGSATSKLRNWVSGHAAAIIF